ncbi:Protein of unknown function [Colwellia chukchiensis]|uniref:DUF2897 domain-containing protein n=1 Tax=Colwellia chukchiensis TaxID=641665 RepID=A0A1H7G2E7_9GAMM|nr:DUF2897 family protein [Colwellia chukchiensis]SEK32224.1 Protein of unknown function [Colwellia chukchiensis]
MSFSFLLILVIVIGSVVAGILLIKQSARKFKLSEQQQAEVERRKAEQLKKDQQQK